MNIRRAQNREMLGTSLQGRVHYTFDEMVDLFGTPHYWFEDSENPVPNKTRCEWDVVIGNEPVSIYDYCEYERSVNEVDVWHVGGNSVKALQNLMEFISDYYQSAEKIDF